MSSEDYFEQGIAHYKAGELDQAILAFDLAIVLDPWYLEAYQYRRVVRLEMETRQVLDKMDEEISKCDQAILENGEDSVSYYQRGRWKYIRTITSGEPSERINLFEDMENVTVHGGDVFSSRLIMQDVISDLDQAIKLDPDFAAAYHVRGLAYHMQSQKFINITPVEIEPAGLKQAILDYDKAIAIDPEYAPAYHDRGTAYLQRVWVTGQQDHDELIQDLEQATLDLTTAIEKEPQEKKTYINRSLADLLLFVNQDGTEIKTQDGLQRAIEDANKVIDLDPKNFWGYWLRALAYELAAGSAEDKSVASEYSHLSEKDYETSSEIGAALLNQHHFEDLKTRIPIMSLGPMLEFQITDGTIKGEVYTSPAGDLSLKIPELMQPNAVTWDEVAASEDFIVYFSDDIGRWIALQVHPGTLEGGSLEDWVHTNIAQDLNVNQDYRIDTRYGKAYVILYQDPVREATCSVAALQHDEYFYSAIYCLMDNLEPSGPEEVGWRTFAAGIQYEPVDELAIQLLKGLKIGSD